jgi:LCP family protein required for cell wall assembly
VDDRTAEPDDVLSRLGITGESAPTGRAARRRAAERAAEPGRHASPGAGTAGRHGLPESAPPARNGSRHGVDDLPARVPRNGSGAGPSGHRRAPAARPAAPARAPRPQFGSRSGPGSAPAGPDRHGGPPNDLSRNGSVEGLHPFPDTGPGREPSAPGRPSRSQNGTRPGRDRNGSGGVNGSAARGSAAATGTPAGSGRPASRVNGSGIRRSFEPGPAETTALMAPRAPRRGIATDERPTTTLHVYDDDGEPSPPPSPDAPDERAQRIDATLTRLTAAHAGLDLRARETGEKHEAVAAPPRRPRLVRALIAAAVIVLVLAVGTGWGAQRWLASGMGTVAALDPGSGAIVNAAAQQGAQNVLVVASGRSGTGGGTRPATVMVAHVPADGTSMTLLGVPTDLQVNRPPCARFDGTGYGDQTVPAEARSDLASALDVGGPRCATRVVQQLTGLAVTQYVALDLDGLGPAVDAVSGVSVCVPRPVVDRALGPIAPAAGTVTLDGRRARDFARAAAVDGEQAAGAGQVTRQQQVLAAVLDRVVSGTGLLDLPRVAALRAALGPALATDGAGLDQVLALAGPIGSGTGVTYRAVPTTPATQGTGSALAAGDASPLFAALRAGTPLPPPPDAAAPSVADVKVDVLNGSPKTGQAAQVGTVLTGLGFTVGKVASAPEQAGQTVIRFSPDQAAAADVLAASVPSATTVADPGSSGVLQLVLGRSFDSVVKAPTTGPAQAATPVAPAACS